MKIVLINNYDLLRISELWKQEQRNAPAQHLWGYSTLEKYNIQVDVLPFERYKFLKKFSQKLKVLGDLDQQLRVLLKANQYDVVYSAHHLTTLSLSFLRVLGIFKRPIVAVAYQAPRSKSLAVKLFTKLFVAGNDKILCLSNDLLKDLKEMGVPDDKLDPIQWGVDLGFYDPETSTKADPTKEKWQEESQNYIFSPGKTYRDYPTLTSAFRNLDCRLIVSGMGQVVARDMAESPPANVTFLESAVHWQDFIDLYRGAYAVAIPLQARQEKFKNAIGLTAVTEAIAMGKPLIMTRNEYIGIDLEKEGIGLWVEPEDTAGWEAAISYLLANPEIAQEMGRKARRLAEERFNLERFSEKLAEQLQQVHGQQQVHGLEPQPELVNKS